MKSSPKKSVHALSLTAFVLVTVLAGCSSEADEGPELEETTDASSPESTEHIPASADGPAQNVPEPRLPAVDTENKEEGDRATIELFCCALYHDQQFILLGHMLVISVCAVIMMILFYAIYND